MKKFVLTCTQKEDETIELAFSNEGFNGMEIVAILESKKADLIEQFTHPEKFTYIREYKDEDGSTVIKKKIDEKIAPIKSKEFCGCCIWGIHNAGCRQYNRCKDCPNVDDFKICKCSSILIGDPCPYFKEVSNNER